MQISGANTATSIDMVKSAMKNDDSVSISTPGAIEQLEEAVEILRNIIDSQALIVVMKRNRKQPSKRPKTKTHKRSSRANSRTN